MKRIQHLAALTLGAALIIASFGPSAAQAAGLTESQIQAIVTLVKTFGVDENIVTNVENALRGKITFPMPDILKPHADEDEDEDEAEEAVDIGFAMPIVPAGDNAWRHMVCKRIIANEAFAERGDFVRELQEFLKKWGLFHEEATGFFGPITREALGRFQAEHGLVGAGDVAAGWGVFGPRTRDQIKRWCGRGGDGERFKADPQRGAAPLTVTFSTWWSGFHGNTVKYVIDYGDGVTEPAANCPAPLDACTGPGQNTHTYAADGVYTAILFKDDAGGCGPNADPRCLGAPASRTAVGKLLIHVGAIACTLEYKPVCGAKQVQCVTTPCDPIPTTYGNECAMKADGATFLYEGQCKNDIVTNQPPVVAGMSGPTTLDVNEMGTWEVSASDPENGTLSYQIIWGDERFFDRVLSAALSVASGFQQSASFTHTYSQAGIYTIIVVVQDDKGNHGKTTMSVKVGNAETIACTMDAKQCPDGSYVGRTGPNCEFKCPTTSATNTCVYNGQMYASGQYTELDCSGDGRACWNSGKVYVCRAGNFKWETCGWGNLAGPRDPLTCEGGKATKAPITSSGSSCTGALGTYGHGQTIDGQIITGGPFSLTAVWPSYTCTNGVWKCSKSCWPGTEGRAYTYKPPAGTLHALEEVDQ